MIPHWENIFTMYYSEGLISIKYKSVLVAQSFPTLCDPIVYSPPGSLVHRVLQARIVEWIAIPFSKGSFQRRSHSYVYISPKRQALVRNRHTVIQLPFLQLKQIMLPIPSSVRAGEINSTHTSWSYSSVKSHGEGHEEL